MKDLAIGVILFVILMAGLVLIISYGEKRACASKGIILKMESQYSFYSGCFVQRQDGKFIPLDSIRGNEF